LPAGCAGGLDRADQRRADRRPGCRHRRRSRRAVLLRLTGLPAADVTLALGVLVFEARHKGDRNHRWDDGLAGIQFAKVLASSTGASAADELPVRARLARGAVRGSQTIVASPFGSSCRASAKPVRMRLIGNSVLPHLTIAYRSAVASRGVAGALFTEANAFVGLGVLASTRPSTCCDAGSGRHRQPPWSAYRARVHADEHFSSPVEPLLLDV